MQPPPAAAVAADSRTTAYPAPCPACREPGSDSDPPAYDHKQAGAAPGLVR